MMYIPNRGGVSPLSISYGGNAELSNVIGGTGFFTAPARVANASLGRIRVAYPIYGYPQVALDAAMTKTWHLEASLSAGGLSISVSSDFAVPSTETLVERLTDGKGQSINVNELETGTGSEQLLLQISGLTLSGISFATDEVEWQLSLEVFAGYSNEDGDTSTCGRGISYPPSGGAHGGITFTIGDQEFPLYIGTDDSSLPTGSITLTPAEWFR